MSEGIVESEGEKRKASLDHIMDHDELFELGMTHFGVFERSGVPKDNEEAIRYLSRALELAPNDHRSLSFGHAYLGTSFGERYRRLGQLDDIEKAIEHHSYALELTANGHPVLSERHAKLGEAFSYRYERLGRLDDLKRSIEHRTRALALITTYDYPFLPGRHADLGVSYGHRHRHLGQVYDLETSIEHKSRALALTPDGDLSLSDRYLSLGMAYGDRYRCLGHLDDLEKSIEYKSRALTLTPDGDPSLSTRYSNLGAAYGDRYRYLGQLEDLDKSTEYFFRALELTPDGHASLSLRHVALGVSYSDRYRHQSRLNDLEKSIEHKLRALALTLDDHPSLPDRHAHLGVSYNERYRRLGQVDDLERSIEHKLRALALTPDGHSSLSARHAALGVSYSDRYQHMSQGDDLDKAINHNSRAVALTPPESSRFSNSILPAGIYILASLLAGLPRGKFKHALYWANLAFNNNCLNPLEAYQTTIDLLPQFVWLGATTQQRYQDLVTAENLATSAASTAIIHSDFKLALEWLEHARCVVWNQSLMLRSPMDELQSSRPDLAARLQTIAQQLHEASSESVSSASQVPASESVDSEQIGKQRRRLAKEYEDLLARARALPGFEKFLHPTKADRLVRAARNGPVVIINCHQDRCDALLISPGRDSIEHLPLPTFTHNKATGARCSLETSLRNKGIRERGFRVQQALGDNDSIARVLLTLWNDVVKPVLECLGYLDNVPAHSLPHITWCPTGALSFLPLHAAGNYSQPGSRVFDYVVSSYVPTLTPLLQVASTPNSSEHPPRVLGIGQANTPGHTPLPGTTTELECVANHIQAKADYAELTGSKATTADVLDAMDKHDWVHLACHAHQNVEDPTKSGFFLHDGTLDLATLNRRSFKGKGLAFLSACQTATGDEKLPDEAIHLASGMLMAGYPSVIATMWSVMDKDAPFVADKVYAQLMGDGRVENGRAGRALHNAVAGLREKVGEKDFARWVPYIHIGS